ncbi:MAG TPA: hypothetical protein VF550_15510 [Polyangia bacterium]
MSKPTANPPRLSCLAETEDPHHVGRMFRSARELPHEELPTLRWRLRASQRQRAMRPRAFLRLALTIGLVFCMGGGVGAVVIPYWTRKEPVVVNPPSTPAPPSRYKKPLPATASPAMPTPTEPVPDETPPVPDEPKPVPAPAKHRAPVRVAMLNEPTPPTAPSDVPKLAPPVVPSPIAVEQALLGQAMRRLRDGHDARSALAVLEQRADQFPQGVFDSEATMLRVEALLTLGRRDEALSVLDRVALASVPNRVEQLVVRGELRAAKGRWREAEHDFEEALGAGGLPATSAKVRNIQERALWGRASARSRLGDQAGARADLDLYLRHFPGGRFAGPAASLLKGSP